MRYGFVLLAFIISLKLSFGFELFSKDFKNGGYIPPAYTCLGKDVSPELHWKNPPKGTKSFVLIVQDIDAPGGIFYHWMVYDIPSYIKSLKQGTKLYHQGINSFGNVGYGGPCPPPGKAHRYYFDLYALNINSLNLPQNASIDQIRDKMRSHILGTAFLFGLFKK